MPRSRFRSRSRVPASTATSERISQFRGSRRPLPPGDKRVLAVLILHLCFLPWAMGTMHPWSQITSLCLAAIGFVVALTAPAAFSPPPSGVSLPTSAIRSPSAIRRLLKFPLFWLGLGLLGYMLMQAFNPSWRYTTNGTTWWLVHVPNVAWLPTSVDTPFERFSLWRQFIIYASAWLTLCTVAIGLTRRRSFGVLLTALSVNGIVLVLIGFLVRFTGRPGQQLWFSGRSTGAMPFASFIYKNHAGAYLALIAVALLVLAARWRERSLREHARSSPALLPVLGTLAVFFAVVFTYSRGATLLLGGYLLAAGVAFALHRYFTQSNSGTPRVVTFTVTAMVAFVVIFALAQLDFRRSIARFEQLADPAKTDISVSQRLEANEAGRDMLSNSWPRGVGAGGFRHLFPEYIRRFEGSYRNGRLFWEHAHDDWLEIPIELGFAGSLLLFGGGVWWLWRVGRKSVVRSLPALLLAMGLVQTLAHAGIDFPFQNPAILITWLVLAVVAARYTAPESAATDRRY